MTPFIIGEEGDAARSWLAATGRVGFVQTFDQSGRQAYALDVPLTRGPDLTWGAAGIGPSIFRCVLVNGYAALFVSASELLNDLAAQGTGSALTRRLHHYCRPHLLVIDELGYL